MTRQIGYSLTAPSEMEKGPRRTRTPGLINPGGAGRRNRHTTRPLRLSAMTDEQSDEANLYTS